MSSSTQGVKKGLWSAQEDSKLVAAISLHGVGRWNSLAQSAEDLQRSGKSCRLRWLNYLRPNVRRGGFTHEERLLILQLHFSWGNKWSKIAEQLPGRTDNDIKNYWRTRVLKHAKRLNCDVNSPVFKHAIHHNWIPALADWVKFGSGPSMSQLPVEEYGILEGSCSSSAASDSVVLVQAQKDGQMKVNGPEFGPLEIEPNPLETSDDQFLEKLLSDEDVFYLHNLLFNSTDSSS